MSKLRIPLRPVHPAMAAALTPAALATARTPLKISLASGGKAAAPAGTPVPHHRGPGAYRYIQYGRFQEALNALAGTQTRDGQWYYLSALANDGAGNRVTALEHIRRAVSMEPDNTLYQQVLTTLEQGGAPIAARPAPTAASAAWGTCACPCACAGAPSGASAPGAEGKICFELPSKDFWQEIGDSSDFLPDFSL